MAAVSGSPRSGWLQARGWIVAGALATLILGIIIEEIRDLNIDGNQRDTTMGRNVEKIDALEYEVRLLRDRLRKVEIQGCPRCPQLTTEPEE